MHQNRRIQFASYAALTIGAFLLFLGARDFLGARIGQAEAARAFANARPSEPQTPQTETKPHRIYQPVQRGDSVAKLLIPRLGAELYVVEGDSADELRQGPGHLVGSVMPGADGNCIIAGHRDTHFRVLKDIRKGDDILLETSRGEYLYRVQSTGVILPDNLAPLKPSLDAELHLITCYPFYYAGPAPKRFVVQAQLTAAVSRRASRPSGTSD